MKKKTINHDIFAVVPMFIREWQTRILLWLSSLIYKLFCVYFKVLRYKGQILYSSFSRRIHFYYFLIQNISFAKYFSSAPPLEIESQLQAWNHCLEQADIRMRSHGLRQLVDDKSVTFFTS